MISNIIIIISIIIIIIIVIINMPFKKVQSSQELGPLFKMRCSNGGHALCPVYAPGTGYVHNIDCSPDFPEPYCPENPWKPLNKKHNNGLSRVFWRTKFWKIR